MITTPQFLEALQKSNLITTSQFAEVKSFAGSDAAADAVARQLIKLKVLTPWQAKRLLEGKSTFFVGNYKLLKRLGSGDSGSVFKAEQTGTKRPVVIKVLPKEMLAKPDAVERFRREVRATASLKHPHIVAAYDAGQLGDVHYLIMEYVGGADLTGWQKKHGELPIPWSCEVIRQVADGLEHVRAAGLVHRDLNPTNILVTTGPDSMPWAKILDFGRVRNIAETQKSGERLTMRGESLGDQDFISPEQARSARDADIRADIYALGASFYWMLTGKVPHDYPNLMQKMTALFKKPPPPVSTLRKDIPPGVEKVISKMLAIDVADRYQTPAEVVWDITPFALGSNEVLGEEPPTGEEEPSHVARDESVQIAELTVAPAPEKNDSVYEFLAKLANQARS